MSDMPQWFSWFVLACGLSIFIASMFYVREYLRFRKAVRKADWPKPADSVSIAAHLIGEMDPVQLQELSNQTGIRLSGGRSV
jgi:hypothetical protein